MLLYLKSHQLEAKATLLCLNTNNLLFVYNVFDGKNNLKPFLLTNQIIQTRFRTISGTKTFCKTYLKNWIYELESVEPPNL